jgi:OmpA-like transmembrane domain
MKKLTFIAAIAGVFLIETNSQAQGFYAGAQVGYGLPSQVQPFFPNVISGTNSTTTNNKSYSLGAGMAVGIYGGYMLNENIGLELGLSEKFNNSVTATSYITTPFPSTDVYTAKGSVLGITPGIRLMTGSDRLKIYTVTGLIIGMPSATLEDNGTHTMGVGGGGTVTNTSDVIYTYSGNIIIGFDGTLGVMYMLTDKIGVFAEITGDFEDWAPDEQLITTD